MAGSVPTLKPLLFQYSLYSFIAYSSIAPSAAPIEVPPGADRLPPPPLATPLFTFWTFKIWYEYFRESIFQYLLFNFFLA